MGAYSYSTQEFTELCSSKKDTSLPFCKHSATNDLQSHRKTLQQGATILEGHMLSPQDPVELANVTRYPAYIVIPDCLPNKQ